MSVQYLLLLVSIFLILFVVLRKASDKKKSQGVIEQEHNTGSDSEPQSTKLIDAMLQNGGTLTPYMRQEETIRVIGNDSLIAKGRTIVTKIYNFVQEVCTQDDFRQEVETFLPNRSENAIIAFYIGDITNCILGIGGDKDVCSPHGVVLAIAVNTMQHCDDLSTPLKLSCITDKVMQTYQEICAGFYGACCAVHGYNTFLISTVLHNIRNPRYQEFIGLMVELTEYLISIKDTDPSQSKQFLQNLQDLKVE